MVLKGFQKLGMVLILGLAAQAALADSPSFQGQKGWSTRGCTHPDDGFSCVRYVKNYDGDTITFDIPSVHPLLGDEIMIRVKGIDTAEKRTKDDCEKRVALHTQKVVQDLLENAKRIDLNNSERGKYFRVLADVYVDGQSVAEFLIKQNLAVRYHGGTKPDVDWCSR